MKKQFVSYSNNSVAIIGLGCRLPGGIKSLDDLWQALSNKKDLITEVPEDRFQKARFIHNKYETKGHSVTFKAGIIEDIKKFDAQFFKMSKTEASSLDPQQRLVLEMTQEALEYANIKPSSIAGTNTAVFIGAASTDMAMSRADDVSSITPYGMTGTNLSIISNRISYFYDLHGESMTIDTACSSSLTAFHKACQALRNKDCECAIAGGVNILLSPLPFVGFSQAHMLSKDGHCKVFSDNGDGYVRSEGGAVFLLKRLDDALSSNDNILAVVEDSLINQDGKTNGISLPNFEAQKKLLNDLYSRYNHSLDDLVYVEAHGTGTLVGDPIECRSIGSILGLGLKEEANRKLLVGSVKSNIGHLETASGMAGLLKVLMILSYKQIPANIFCDTLNKNIDFDGLNLHVVREMTSMPKTSGPAMIGLNSFGFGGSNAHLIVREFDTSYINDKKDQEKNITINTKSKDIFSALLSAESEESLYSLAKEYASLLEQDVNVDELFASVIQNRDLYTYKVFITANSRESLKVGLEEFAKQKKALNTDTYNVTPSSKNLKDINFGFVYSGNGSQYVGMAKDLYGKSKVFAKFFKEIDVVLQKYQDYSLVELFDKPLEQWDIDSPCVAQPLIFAFESAVSKTLIYYGVNPKGVVGHSVGEVAAAYISGALSLECACNVIVKRSFYQSKTSNLGSMAAVKLKENILLQLLDKPEYSSISVAAENASDSFTVSGLKTELQLLQKEVKENKGFFKLLNLSYAFHSSLMNDIEQDLLVSLSEVVPNDTQIDFYSTVYAKVTEGKELSALYWWHNVREKVEFKKTIEQMIDDGIDYLVEIGPKSILISYLKQIIKDKETKTETHKLFTGTDDSKCLIEFISFLNASNASIDLSKFIDLSKATRKICLPKYPFNKNYYWFEPTSESYSIFNANKNDNIIGYSNNFDSSFVSYIDENLLPFLSGHRISDKAVFPFAAYLEVLYKAGMSNIKKQHNIRLFNVNLFASLDLSEKLQTLCTTVSDSRQIKLKIRDYGAEDFYELAKCRYLPSEPISRNIDVQKVISSAKKLPIDLYFKSKNLGIDYQDNFQCVEDIYAFENKIIAKIKYIKESDDLSFSISGLDGVLQLLFVFLSDEFDSFENKELFGFDFKSSIKDDNSLFLPSEVQEFTFIKEPSSSYCYGIMEVKKVQERTIVTEISMYDIIGNECLRLQGCRYRKVGKQFSEMPMFYSENWQFVPNKHLSKNLISYSLNENHIKQITEDSNYKALLNALFASYIYEYCDIKEEFVEVEILFGILLAEDKIPFAHFLLNILVNFGYAQRQDELYNVQVTDELNSQLVFNTLIYNYPEQASEILFISMFMNQLKLILTNALTSTQINDLVSKAQEVLNHDTCELQLKTVLFDTIQRELTLRSNNNVLRILDVISEDRTYGSCLSDIEHKNLPCSITRLYLNEQAKINARAESDLYHLTAELVSLEEINDNYFDLIFVNNSLVNKEIYDLSKSLLKYLSYNGKIIDVSYTDNIVFDFKSVLTGDYYALDQDNNIYKKGNSLDSVIKEYSELIGDVKQYNILNNINILEVSNTLNNYDSYPLVSLKEQATNDILWLYESEYETNTKYFNTNYQSMTFEQYLSSESPIYNCIVVDASTIKLESAESVPHILYSLKNLIHKIKEFETNNIIIKIAPFVTTTIKNINVNSSDLEGICSRSIMAMVRTIQSEVGFNSVRCVALSNNSEESWHNFNDLILDNAFNSYEVLIHNDSRYILQEKYCDVKFIEKINEDNKEDFEQSSYPKDNFVLSFDRAGKLSSLQYKKKTLRQLKPHEVLVEVKATGLNFRDVMWASGMLPDEALESGFAGASLGLECSGIIKAVGSQVFDYAIGDEVIAFGQSCFSSYMITSSLAITKKPTKLSFEIGASLPVVFFTAYYSIVCKACAKKGEKILIHAACGGVGQAAIQIAQHLGLEIYATAGSEYKRDYLRNLGIKHIYNTRSLSFYDQIMNDTSFEGVDIVVNSLYDEQAQLSLSLLKPNGRFIELGKRDFYEDNTINLKSFKDNLSYFGVDADEIINLNPQIAQTILQKIMNLFEQGVYKPIPLVVYDNQSTQKAFVDLRSSLNIGKVVVKSSNNQLISETEQKSNRSVNLSENLNVSISKHAPIVISGGLGGIGYELSRKLALEGENLILIGRKALTEEINDKLVELKTLSNNSVEYIALDMTDRNKYNESFVSLNLSEIKAFYHTAAVLDDGLSKEMQLDSFVKVYNAKVLSVLNFMDFIKKSNIKIGKVFLFSSVTTMLGNPGQANYVASNASLEALSNYLRAQGIDAISIGWGAVSDKGMLSSRNNVLALLERRLGARGISTSELLWAIDKVRCHDKLFACSESNLFFFKINWQSLENELFKYSRFKSIIQEFNIKQNAQNNDFIKIISNVSSKEELFDVLTKLMRTLISDLAGVEESTIKLDSELASFGMDSLSLMELAVRLEEVLKCKIQPVIFAGSKTLHDFVSVLTKLMYVKDSTSNEELLLASMEKQHGVVLSDTLHNESRSTLGGAID